MTKQNLSHLADTIDGHLTELCVKLPHRHVGSLENQQASDYVARTLAGYGFQVECPAFDCIDWAHGAVMLQANGTAFEAHVSPYSLPCDLTAPLVSVETVSALEQTDLTNHIVLLRGELAQEQLMPKNFIFYNPDHHRHIISLLEQKQPRAIIAATERNPELAGAWYPFPLFEDGDFDIPSVFMTAEEGTRLLNHNGANISLQFDSRRIPSHGCNVIAHKGKPSAPRIVLCAHVDSKQTTPGALDNATGVSTLLGLAELLTNYHGDLLVELVIFNGEDYYAASGEMLYLTLNEGAFDTIQLAINIDLAGYHATPTAYSLYGCPDDMATIIREGLSARPDFEEGEPWYQSDHSLFIAQQCPAVAIASSNLMELSTEITHTEKDTIDLVDSTKLAHLAEGLREVVLGLSSHFSSDCS